MGTTIHGGLGFASATRLLHSLHSILIPRTAYCLAVSSLGDWTAPQCFLSNPRVRRRKVGLPSYCLRHQPPILQERGGQQRTFKRNLSLFVLNQPRRLGFEHSDESFYWFCVTHLALQCSDNLCVREESRDE